MVAKADPGSEAADDNAALLSAAGAAGNGRRWADVEAASRRWEVAGRTVVVAHGLAGRVAWAVRAAARRHPAGERALQWEGRGRVAAWK